MRHCQTRPVLIPFKINKSVTPQAWIKEASTYRRSMSIATYRTDLCGFPKFIGRSVPRVRPEMDPTSPLLGQISTALGGIEGITGIPRSPLFDRSAINSIGWSDLNHYATGATFRSRWTPSLFTMDTHS